jgi:hypothetical protein
METKLPTHIIKKGRYKGHAIDNRTRRSIKLIEETDGYFIVDYFFHEGDFYTAKIPKNSIKEIKGQRFNFSQYNPLVNHAQIRITLNKNFFIELYKIGQYTDEKPLHKIDDFVYSIEVTGPLGKSWSLKDAFGAFVSAHRFVSTSEVVFERVTLGNYEMNQSPPLKFSDSQLEVILEHIVHRAHKAADMSERYYLINLFFGATNCTSEMFKMLDRIKKDEYTIPQKLLAKCMWRLPFALKLYLKVRGVVDYSMPRQTLNKEFSELARSEGFLLRVRLIKDKGIKIQT